MKRLKPKARCRILTVANQIGLKGRLGVAVSGGGDSLALLHMCYAEGLNIRAVSVDHGLRKEARSEAEYVAGFCANHRIPHDILTWEPGHARGNIQAAARDARYQLIAKWAQSAGLDYVALGHTQDDVAETFLMRLARKAGLDGLAAMQERFERYGMIWHRPLLHISRAELRDYLRVQNITWIEDPSNDDARYTRVRARQMLADFAQSGLPAPALASSAQALRRARSALWHYIKIEAQNRITQEHGDLLMQLGTDLPGEVEWHLFALALAWTGGQDYPPRTSAYEQMRQRLEHAKKHTLAGCLITQSGQSIRISREPNAAQKSTAKLDQLWDNRWRIEGPFDANITLGALGTAISQIPNWREQGQPYESLKSSPALWRSDQLIAAPLAQPHPQWLAIIDQPFTTYLDSH
jgi:tRNA(Ile)-lysidine synthase